MTRPSQGGAPQGWRRRLGTLLHTDKWMSLLRLQNFSTLGGSTKWLMSFLVSLLKLNGVHHLEKPPYAFHIQAGTHVFREDLVEPKDAQPSWPPEPRLRFLDVWHR